MMIPKFGLGELVFNIVIDSYFIVSEINIDQNGIKYVIENGSVTIDIEEKYLVKGDN